jgi:hypothetical protein
MINATFLHLGGTMLDIIKDTLIDTIKLLPFLFITFTIIELIEHKINNKKIITKSKKYGPFFGSILGVIPQCGISASATNLYATRIITLGTLISVYLSTSDEMLPLLLANKTNTNTILKILGLKFLIGMISGFIIDLILRKKEQPKIESLCEHDHCNCNHNHSIIKSAIKHTISITIFIMIFSFIINIIFEYLGQTFLENMFMKNTIFSYFLSSLVGLIPNCGASILITELYINNTITLGAAMSGLLTGAGIGLLILFKTNKNIKENITIISLIYIIGIISGIIIDLIGAI